MSVIVRGDRGAFGGVLTPPQTAPLRLGTLAARAAVRADPGGAATGDVVAGALTCGRHPERRWTLVDRVGYTITPPRVALAAPGGRRRASLGTRLVLEARRRRRRSTPSGAIAARCGRRSRPARAHTWYQGATERLRLDTDGTLPCRQRVGRPAPRRGGRGHGAYRHGRATLHDRTRRGGVSFRYRRRADDARRLRATARTWASLQRK